MVKSVLGVSHLGLRDWLVQRLTAVYLAIYTLGLVFFLMWNGEVTYYEWHGLFIHDWMKVTTLIAVVCVLLHAWIGMWTVFTDYVKPFLIRFCLYVLVLLGLIACFFEALLILWGI